MRWKRTIFNLNDKNNNINSHKNLIVSCIEYALVGGINPIIEAMIGYVINELNSKFKNIRYEKVLKYGLLFLLVFFYRH